MNFCDSCGRPMPFVVVRIDDSKKYDLCEKCAAQLMEKWDSLRMARIKAYEEQRDE